MIIQEIKLKKKFFFFNEYVSIVTSEGKISLEESWDSGIVDKLNDKLKGFKIESADDFERLKESVKEFGIDKYSIIEKVVSDNLKMFWRFFDPAAVQVPRPMSVILRKDKGVKEYVVFSLSASNFDAVVNANRHIADHVAKKISDVDNMKEEDILMIIREAIDNEHELVDFEIRLGVVLDNFIDGKYRYANEDFDSEQQYGFVSKLIDSYGVFYFENPFREDDLSLYKKFSENYMIRCLVCLNSKINEYTKRIQEKAFNTVIAKFVDVPSFKADVNFFKDKKINIIAEANVNMNIVVGLGIPLIKMYDDAAGNDAARKISNIVNEIAESKKT